MTHTDDLPSWGDIDVDGNQEAQLCDEWRAVQDDPPLGVVEIEIPKELCWLGQPCPQ